jgi:hypothetical protein
MLALFEFPRTTDIAEIEKPSLITDCESEKRNLESSAMNPKLSSLSDDSF